MYKIEMGYNKINGRVYLKPKDKRGSFACLRREHEELYDMLWHLDRLSFGGTKWRECISKFDGLPDGKSSFIILLSDDNPENCFYNNDNNNICLNVTPNKISFVRYGNKVYPDLQRVYRSLFDNYIEEYAVIRNKWDILRDAQIDYRQFDDEADGNAEDWDAGNIYNGDGNRDGDRETIINRIKLPLYVFQKCYMYSLVYYEMFDCFLNNLSEEFSGDKIKLNVLSIGCGSKSDALALKYAVQDYSNFVKETSYIGIDPGEWNVSNNVFYLNNNDKYVTIPYPEDYTGGRVEYCINWECDYIRSEDFRSYIADNNETEDGIVPINIVVFPNMLSEIRPANLLNSLLDVINDVYSEQNLYLLASRNILKSDGTRRDDSQHSVICNYNNGYSYEYIAGDVPASPENERQGSIHIFNNDDIDIYRRFKSKSGELCDYDGHNIEPISRFMYYNPEGSLVKNPLLKRKFIQYVIYKRSDAQE